MRALSLLTSKKQQTKPSDVDGRCLTGSSERGTPRGPIFVVDDHWQPVCRVPVDGGALRKDCTWAGSHLLAAAAGEVTHVLQANDRAVAQSHTPGPLAHSADRLPHRIHISTAHGSASFRSPRDAEASLRVHPFRSIAARAPRRSPGWLRAAAMRR